MSVIITTLAAIFVFGLVIAVHELGHFICAKRSGIQVNEFAIGMGPAIFKKKHGGTLYSIRLLPIGGYVAMEGEQGMEKVQGENDADAKQKKEEILIAPEERTGKPFNEVSVAKRFITISAGAIMNLVLGFVVLLILVISQDQIVSRVIHSFDENAISAQTGLKVGDEIIAVNGWHCFVANDILYELTRIENTGTTVTVKRDGEIIDIENVMFLEGTNPDGTEYMDIQFIVEGHDKTFLNVISEAVRYELYYGRIIFTSLMDLLTGRMEANNLSGPVGIVSAIGQAASYGILDLLSLLALITVNLGIFNLLPFPALDGGQLVFLLIEGITGKVVPLKIQGYINAVGISLLLLLMVFATYQDILRIFTGTM